MKTFKHFIIGLTLVGMLAGNAAAMTAQELRDLANKLSNDKKTQLRKVEKDFFLGDDAFKVFLGNKGYLPVKERDGFIQALNDAAQVLENVPAEGPAQGELSDSNTTVNETSTPAAPSAEDVAPGAAAPVINMPIPDQIVVQSHNSDLDTSMDDAPAVVPQHLQQDCAKLHKDIDYLFTQFDLLCGGSNNSFTKYFRSQYKPRMNGAELQALKDRMLISYKRQAEDDSSATSYHIDSGVGKQADNLDVSESSSESKDKSSSEIFVDSEDSIEPEPTLFELINKQYAILEELREISQEEMNRLEVNSDRDLHAILNTMLIEELSNKIESFLQVENLQVPEEKRTSITSTINNYKQNMPIKFDEGVKHLHTIKNDLQKQADEKSRELMDAIFTMLDSLQDNKIAADDAADIRARLNKIENYRTFEKFGGFSHFNKVLSDLQEKWNKFLAEQETRKGSNLQTSLNGIDPALAVAGGAGVIASLPGVTEACTQLLSGDLSGAAGAVVAAVCVGGVVGTAAGAATKGVSYLTKRGRGTASNAQPEGDAQPQAKKQKHNESSSDEEEQSYLQQAGKFARGIYGSIKSTLGLDDETSSDSE